MFKQIKIGFGRQIGRFLFFVLISVCITIFLFLVSAFKAHAETIDMPTPTNSLEIYRNGGQYINSSLPTVNWYGTAKNVGGVNILNFDNGNYNPINDLHIYYNDIANANSSYIEFTFYINYNFDLRDYNPYSLSSIYVETANYVYTPCNIIGSTIYDINNVGYHVSCTLNRPLTSWNINPRFNFSTGDYPFINNNDRVRFGISYGNGGGSIITNATQQDVVNSIQNMNNDIISNQDLHFTALKVDIGGLPGRIVNGFLSYIQDILNALSSVVTSILNGVSGFFSNLWSYISGGFTNVITAIGNIGSNVWSNFSTGFNNVITAIGNIGSNVWSGSASGLGTLFSNLGNLIQSIFIPTNFTWSSLWTNTLQPIYNQFIAKLGIIGLPFHVIEKFYEAFENITTSNTYIINIPEIKDPFYNVTIINATSIDLKSFVSSGILQTIYNIYLVAVDVIVIFSLSRFSYSKFQDIFEG